MKVKNDKKDTLSESLKAQVAHNGARILTHGTRSLTISCGLPDDMRAIKNALAYAVGEMTASEYCEMYDAGSSLYKEAANNAIIDIRRSVGDQIDRIAL